MTAQVTETPTHIRFHYQGTDFLFRKDGKFEGWSRIRPCDPLEVEVRKLKAAVVKAEREVELLLGILKEADREPLPHRGNCDFPGGDCDCFRGKIRKAILFLGE